ncbi:Aminopeptidase 2 mitochondrial [Allomyces javanicus]|nr:Aminopeptidase 2 mitochondrial [Allomyces javanicus]
MCFTDGAAAAASGREILPATVVPEHYTLELTPDLESFTFDGIVHADVKIVHATSAIVVNAFELDIKAARVQLTRIKTEATLPASSITYDEKLQQATLHFDQELPADAQARVTIEFQGIHNDKMAGFYRSSYADPDGTKKFMVVTQFEATDARRCLPCWDEPALKATFDVILNVQKDLSALSNMNIIFEDAHPTLASHKTVKFARTPVMSTYLLALAVGDFEYIQAKTAPNCPALPNQVTVRVYTTRGLSNQGKFALGCAVRILEYFSAVFGEPYPLPKMDMMAVPDFSAGAMENWGLVTYRTAAILFDDKKSTALAKERVAGIVSHELAHQWFGNLVTMQWWNELWLNEGFATFVGTLAIARHLFPEWDSFVAFVGNDMARALTLDAMRSSHPIEVPVKSPAEISQIFDAISYSKGASVIRMLSSWLTEDVFLAGVRKYIQRLKYRNAATTDLWAALSEASGMDVGEFMTLWTKKVGYPVISAERQGNAVTVKQARFLSTGDATPDEDETVWWCPLAPYVGGEPTNSASVVLKQKEGTFALPAKPTAVPVDFYKLNLDQANFYRVQYAAADLARLGEAVEHGLVPTSDRVGLISDVFALAAAGYSSTVDALALLSHFKGEQEYVVLEIIASKLAQVKTVWAMEPDPVGDQLAALQRSIFAPTAHAMGWEYPDGESHLDGLKRQLAIGQAGMAGDKELVAQAKARFARFIQGDTHAIHPNLRGAVYAIVLRHSSVSPAAKGGEPHSVELEAVKAIWENESTPMDQRLAALGALGHVQDSTLLAGLLEYAMDESKVRPQDVMYPLRSVAANARAGGRVLAWKFVQQRWDELHARYQQSLSLLAHCVSIAGDFASAEFAETEVEGFFAGKDTEAVDRALMQTLEKIRAQAAWLERDRAPVQAWLAENVQN